MKNILLIFVLIFATNTSFAAKSCSTGYACSLDKLREQEKLEQQQQILNNTKPFKSPETTKKDLKTTSKNGYKDLFIYTNPVSD